MEKNKNAEKEELTCRIHTRLTKKKYDELSDLLKQCRGIHSLSELLRNILNNKTIITQGHDAAKEKIMEQLGAIRKEMLAIGVNINQVTHVLHQTDCNDELRVHAEEILRSCQDTQAKINEFFAFMDEFSARWSSK